MFKDWTDEKLKEEAEGGLRDYAVKKQRDNEELVTHYQQQIAEKLKEMNQLEWEMEVAYGDIREWQEVIARIDALVPKPTE
ncbi:hypothetical protein Kirov_105 [Bacillus phage Kirov]|uniref:Uncharacterized protein n=1 Tax=Bacillus phage Kirov TaxID=2783539 RepID=A0A7U3RYA7_9CAUD|nr:hypothetical protein PQE67_gp199 [Bacillus phage Kirov]QOV08304.1 hypothetical protein Kirov_105 [Bacillus phage Kirov]